MVLGLSPARSIRREGGLVNITEKPIQKAVGHLFYATRHRDALDLLETAGEELENHAHFETDKPYNSDGDPVFKITVIVEQI
jgi:hypothetical protein